MILLYIHRQNNYFWYLSTFNIRYFKTLSVWMTRTIFQHVIICLLSDFWVLFSKLQNIQKTLWDRAQWATWTCKEKAWKNFIQPTHKSILTPQKNTLKGCVWTVVVVVFPGVWHSHSCLFSEVWCESVKSPHSWATDVDPDEEVSTACCNNWRDSRLTAFPSMCSLRCRADWTAVTLPQFLKSDRTAYACYIPFSSNPLHNPNTAGSIHGKSFSLWGEYVECPSQKVASLHKRTNPISSI